MTIFTKLDLQNMYYLVHIREGDKWMAAFDTLGPLLIYFNGFWFNECPCLFPSLINNIIRDFLNVFMLVYLDDILLYYKDP